jgi:hypothetical protein
MQHSHDSNEALTGLPVERRQHFAATDRRRQFVAARQ